MTAAPGKRIDEERAICMPSLSVIALAIVRLRRGYRHTVVYYDRLPRSLRRVSRVTGVSHGRIARVLAAAIGVRVSRITPADPAQYHRVHFRAIEIVTRIAASLIPAIENDVWIDVLSRAMEREAAVAYAVQQIGCVQLFDDVRPIVVYTADHPLQPLIVVWSPLWTPRWLQALVNNLPVARIEFFDWPEWYRVTCRAWAQVHVAVTVLVRTVAAIARRGLPPRPIEKKPRFRLMLEFVDPRRMNGGAHDGDYWIDDAALPKEDVLWFVTEEQERRLRKSGVSAAAIEDRAVSKGYRLAFLSRLSYTTAFLTDLAGAYRSLLRTVRADPTPVLAHVVPAAWSAWLEYAPLFLHYDSPNLLYVTMPNGASPIRFDSGAVTGLCRRFGIRSIGCQTRVVYASHFEFAFECHDVYLAWGDAWVESRRDVMRFVRRVEVVGCTYLDAFVYALAHVDASGFRDRPVRVAVFPSDIDSQQFTAEYTWSFLLKCAALAAAYPQSRFTVKFKDPDHATRALTDERFRAVIDELGSRFTFEQADRHDYRNLLDASDVVIAIGFTTPGTEALLLGKRVIYYSEIAGAGTAFAGVPGLVATNEAELTELFGASLARPDLTQDGLDGLDPYRDGRALSRIARLLAA